MSVFRNANLHFRSDMKAIQIAGGRIAGTFYRLGPYALLELLLPGGSLIALSLWLWRRSRNRPAKVRVALKVRTENVCVECYGH